MKRSSSREKHSFIQFYFDDWKAGTAHMTRLVRSIYFDICLYNWDKRRAVSPGALLMMTADVENAAAIINALVEEGALETDDKGFVHSPRALREAERAYGAWVGKSRGGRGGGSAAPVGETGSAVGGKDESGDESSSVRSKLQHSSEVCSTDSDSDSEPDSEEEEDSDSRNELDGRSVVEAWNDMARRNGLKQIAKMTAERIGRLAERIVEHGGPQALIAGIKLIPETPFLLGRGDSGWKASFDWFLKPDSLVHLIEGRYEPRPGGAKAKAPTSVHMGDDDAARANERLEAMGSTMRWRKEGSDWRLKPGA